ncbi:MAG: radical SAM protein [Polyangiaceae bacterium]|nr:radical SAM protein [Polyangiaceae bacterium]MCW5792375.1 radical SAM protein [Polyangiaceae bacterium]
MARVAVCFAPLSVSRDFIDYPYFADLGAVQAAAVLRRAGHEVTVYDALATPGATLTPEGDRALLGVPVPTLLQHLQPFDLALVAYTPFHRPPTRDALLASLLTALREAAPSAPILLADLYQSGQHVVDAPSQAILSAYPEVHALLRYEAEGWLPEWVQELTARCRLTPPQNPREVRDGNTGPAIVLDELPLPAWDLVDTEAYFNFHEEVMAGLGRPHWAFPISGRHLPLLSSRGCPFRCAHCSSNPGLTPGQPKTQRRYSRARLAEHLDWLMQRGARSVHLLDELANVNERHFDALLELLAERDLRFEIPNGLRADYVLPKHLAAMRGRLSTLSVSAESGVQRVVDQVVGKQLDLRRIVGTAKSAHEAGVRTLVHYIIGMPGETKADINGTLRFALDLYEKYRAEPSVQYATPLPGTRLEREAIQRGAAQLPVVPDWGPHFQAKPSLASREFELSELTRFRDSFDARLSALRAPPPLVVNLTSSSNERSPFSEAVAPTQRDLSAEEQRRLVVLARQRGATTLEVTGGEPTLSRELLPLVRLARRLGYQSIKLITNARRATYPAYAAQLMSAGLTEVWVRLHGGSVASHQAVTQVPESFEQTLLGLRHLLAHRAGAVVGVTVALRREITRELDDLWARLMTLGVTRARLELPPGLSAADLALTGAGSLELEWVHAPPCQVPPGLAAVPTPPTVEAINYQSEAARRFLEPPRVHQPACEACAHRADCEGFFVEQGLHPGGSREGQTEPPLEPGSKQAAEQLGPGGLGGPSPSCARARWSG